ncbi:thioredoxin family protein [Atopobacter phocae]|uniref:thioredoxin family protein n=1 Tax=Atopobacter phocae TaxID=136492 RepID=UPI00046F10A0|nr:thioredoxin family protein [Atopobacter phocae]
MEYIQSYEALNQLIHRAEPVLIFVSMPTCSVCHAVAPRVQALAKEMEISFYELDASRVKEAAGQLSLFTSPVVMLYRKGREYHRQARVINFEELEKRIQELQTMR